MAADAARSPPAVFKHMDRCSERRLLSTEGGVRRLHVAHEASWRFLFWKGSFTTRLVVEEDPVNRHMAFQLAPNSSGIMAKFRGTWHVRPHPHSPEKSDSFLDQVGGEARLLVLHQRSGCAPMRRVHESCA